MQARVGVVGLWHETNTFSCRSANLGDFAALELAEGADVLDMNHGTGSVIGGFCTASELELVPIFSAAAWPSGPASAETISTLLDRALDGIRRAGHLDGVLLNLHGAMVAEGIRDVEGALLTKVRSLVGEVPIVAVLDLHANTSLTSAAAADVLISYDTYPHVDMFERGSEAAATMIELLRGRRLATAIGRLPLLVSPLAMSTETEPMRSLVERARHRAGTLGIARVCISGGFAYSDVARAGVSVLVAFDRGDDEAALQMVSETMRDIEAASPDFDVRRDDAPGAVERAMRTARTPVILVDVGDNIGGGSAGDGTSLLRELLARRAAGAVVTIADPHVAAQAHELGSGAIVNTVLGGQTDKFHGAPVDIRGTVARLGDGRYRTAGTWMTDRVFSMGRTAIVECDGVQILVTERPTPPFHSEQLSSVGIDASSARIITAKGAVAWRSAFGDIAGEVIEVDTPGVCPIDPWSLPRQHPPERLEACIP